MQLADLETPALLLDREKLAANIERMRAHLAALGVALRPHVKTAKCIEVVRAALAGQPGEITVSTFVMADLSVCRDSGIALSVLVCVIGHQHTAYHVVEGTNPEIRATWSRCNGW